MNGALSLYQKNPNGNGIKSILTVGRLTPKMD